MLDARTAKTKKYRCASKSCRAEGKIKERPAVRTCGCESRIRPHKASVSASSANCRRLSGRYHFDANWTVDLPRSATVAARENPRGGGKRGRCGAEPRSWINCSRRACKSIADEKKRKITLEDDFSSFPRNHAGPLVERLSFIDMVIEFGMKPPPRGRAGLELRTIRQNPDPQPHSIPKQVRRVAVVGPYDPRFR